jgi:hypothetical protein
MMVRLRVAVGPLNVVFAVWSEYIGRWESSYAYRLGAGRWSVLYIISIVPRSMFDLLV